MLKNFEELNRAFLDKSGKQTVYINSSQRGAVADFADYMRAVLVWHFKPGRDLVLLCIGTDKIIGDSLGPIVGHNLAKSRIAKKFCTGKLTIYGTLEHPIHAKNLSDTINVISFRHNKPLIIAVDASLGKPQNVGFVTIGVGALAPGSSIKNCLPKIGDIHVTGIVNSCGNANMAALQNTRLSLVIKMADVISKGFVKALK